VPAGGRGLGEICGDNQPCTCPRYCAEYDDPMYAGSCWPRPGPAGCSDSTDVVLPFGSPPVSYCLPTGPVTGTFSVPVVTSGAPGGTVNVTLTIRGVSHTFTQGYAERYAADGVWLVVFMSPSASSTFLLLQILDAAYRPSTISLDRYATDAYLLLYSQTSSAAVIQAWNLSGSVVLTRADTASPGTAVGSFSSVRVYGYNLEVCGPHSTPC
jgi:hypothetical protein